MSDTSHEVPLLEKWGSVTEIRDYFQKAEANLRDVVREERKTIRDRCEAEVAAFKDARKARSRERARQRQRERRAEAAASATV